MVFHFSRMWIKKHRDVFVVSEALCRFSSAVLVEGTVPDKHTSAAGFSMSSSPGVELLGDGNRALMGAVQDGGAGRCGAHLFPWSAHIYSYIWNNSL